MSFHIVLAHRNAPQVQQHQWLDDNRPAWITVTPEVAMRCWEMQRKQRPVRIHRGQWSGKGPAICCECEIAAVREIDEHSYHVEFANWRWLELIPLVRPVGGQAFYEI